MAYLVGISGGSGSGKTTFIKKLEEEFLPGQLVVLSQDHYYKPLHLQKRNDKGEINFDEPESIHIEKFVNDLQQLQAGNELTIDEYDFNNPNKPGKTLLLEPAKIIIIEGLFILGIEAIENKLDLKLFIDADEDIKLQRRLKRDSEERGMSEPEIHSQWTNHVKPSFEKYILPQRDKVDMVIINNTHFNNSFKVIVDHLRRVLL